MSLFAFLPERQKIAQGILLGLTVLCFGTSMAFKIEWPVSRVIMNTHLAIALPKYKQKIGNVIGNIKILRGFLTELVKCKPILNEAVFLNLRTSRLSLEMVLPLSTSCGTSSILHPSIFI